jgi:hypothetical protein
VLLKRCWTGARRSPRLPPSSGSVHPKLRKLVSEEEADRGLQDAPPTEELAEIKRLRMEVADQRRTIEILKAATPFSPRNSTPNRNERRVGNA